MTQLELEVPAAEAQGLVVRAFAGEVGAGIGLDEERIADLRLAVTELLASAVDAGSDRLRLTFATDEQRWVLVASGVGDLDVPPPELELSRRDLLSGLFDDIVQEGSSARLGAALGS
ncbi:MAG TPA: hypothetical protein VIB62_11125 [Actinomycetota bacterium]|jgi:anti-sigma regulatory factor (Ser/Thr protein kinase)